MVDEKIARRIMEDALKIQSDEEVLVLTDHKRFDLAYRFFERCSERFKSALLMIPEMKYDGARLSPMVAKQLQACDVLIAFTTMSVSHTHAVRLARDKGVRVASLPGITEEIYYRAINVDFDEIVSYTAQLKKIFENKENIRVVTKLGTDVTFSIKHRDIYELNCLCHEKGDFINLPDGEMMIAPIEESVNGRIVFDLSMMPDQETDFGIIARLDEETIEVDIEDGEIVSYNGGNKANILKQVIEDAGENANIVGEFAIGTNPKAHIIGNILEDEKVKGTCHFAFGSNTTLGGKNQSSVHLDGIIDRPTIYVDGEKVIENGILVQNR